MIPSDAQQVKMLDTLIHKKEFWSRVNEIVQEKDIFIRLQLQGELIDFSHDYDFYRREEIL